MNRAGMTVIAWVVSMITTQAQGQEVISNKTGAASFMQSVSQRTFTTSKAHNATLLPGLITEALENNPEIQAAHQEREAAQQRIAPAEALDDPMLEAGVINAPLASSPFNREDMTMKMIGLSQRLSR